MVEFRHDPSQFGHLCQVLKCNNQVVRDGKSIPLVPSSYLKRKQQQQRDFDRVKSQTEYVREANLVLLRFHLLIAIFLF